MSTIFVCFVVNVLPCIKACKEHIVEDLPEEGCLMKGLLHLLLLSQQDGVVIVIVGEN